MDGISMMIFGNPDFLKISKAFKGYVEAKQTLPLELPDRGYIIYVLFLDLDEIFQHFNSIIGDINWTSHFPQRSNGARTLRSIGPHCVAPLCRVKKSMK